MRWLVMAAVAMSLAAGPVALVGCGGTEAPPSIPITYDPRLQPAPLTPQQMKTVLEKIEPLVRTGHEIWYVHVHANSVTQGQSVGNITVFFKPDAAADRLRKGWCTNLYLGDPESQYFADRLSVSSSPADPCRTLDEYVQVSLAEAPFGPGLEVPSQRLWPFDRPRDFSDEDIVEIVDFARTSPSPPQAQAKAGEIVVPLHDRFDGTEPIHWIVRQKDGSVQVHSGAQQAMLAGSGSYMTCIKVNGKWVVLTVGMWVS